MRDKLIVMIIDIDNRTKRLVRIFIFGALINQTALHTGKRQGILIGFNKVLANFRTELFKKEAEMTHNRIVPENRMPVLQYII